MTTLKSSTVKSMYELALEAEESGLVDGRSRQGRTHRCALLIMMILVGLLYKRLTIRGQGRLYHDPNTASEMTALFSPYFEIEKFPSTSCITRFIQTCDTEGLANFLCQWAYQLVDDDGVTPRAWGVDGQASAASKRWKDGGRPLYNVDYFDQMANILTYMDSVESKSQEAVILEKSVPDVLDGHANVYMAGDAMMTKKGILAGILNAGANAFFPLKRNNPKLMDAFCEILEELSFEGDDSVDHYADLSGEPDGVGRKTIKDTETTYEEEDNKKYEDNPRSRPIRDLVFFDNIYPYATEADGEGETPDPGEGIPATASCGSELETVQGVSCTDCPQQVESVDGRSDADRDQVKGTVSYPPGTEHVVPAEGMGAVEAGCGAEDPASALLSEGEKRTVAFLGAHEHGEPVHVTEIADGMQGNSGPVETHTDGNRLGELRLNPDTKGVWVRFGDRYVVLAPSHGRLERREYDLLRDVSDYDIWANVPEKLKDEWEPYIKGIGIATRYRAIPKVVTTGKGTNKVSKTVHVGTATRTVFMFTDPPASAKAFGELTRGYWDIENVLHGVVDNLLGQDKCTCRVGNSTGNMSLFRKIAFNVLSSVRNAIDKVHEREIPFTNILDSLSGRADHIGELLFGRPDEALENYARNHCPSFD